MCVIVTFMCQLDWSTGCLDVWSNIILAVSVRVFLEEINIQIGWVKHITLPNAGGPHPIRWRLEDSKKLTLSQVRENASRLTASEMRHQFFPAFGFKLKHWLLLALRPAGLQTGTIPSALLGHQLADLTVDILGIVSLHIHMSQFLIINQSISL